ncbi:multidrug effflux MFS transporter [Endozoicomonas numazuensis]|uniref:multidrug effflux MFS transporter n=1 Tax=Endozoicomonas numazuensis TaxID=1137799 RepID=UPI00054F7A67|nr:multidrug effflux MFS transporter [Endozoicomonas numazuensis]
MPQLQRSALPVIFALVILSPLAIDIYLPSLPEMTRFFSATDSEVQLTISLFMICMGVGQLFAGPFSDHYGRKASALLGVGLYLMGSVVGALSSSIELLYLARILQGLGAASCSVTAFAWVRDHFSPIESGKWISYMGGMIGTIPTLAPTLGGALAIYWGWEANFVFMALLSGFILLMACRNMQPEVRSTAQGSNTSGHILQNLTSILGNKQFLNYSLSGMLAMGAILTYATHAPYVAINLAGLDEFGFSLFFGLLGIMQLSASLLTPRLIDWLGQRQTIMVGSLFSIIGATGLLLVPNDQPLWFFAPAAIGAIGFNFIFGTASSLTLEHFKHCAGLAAAIDGCARMTGGGLIAFAVKLAGLDAFTTVAFSYALLAASLILAGLDLLQRSKRSAPVLSLKACR